MTTLGFAFEIHEIINDAFARIRGHHKQPRRPLNTLSSKCEIDECSQLLHTVIVN